MQHSENWTEIISAKSSWFDLRLKELWRYRDLVILFVRRDFVSTYKQTILGPLWHIIQPLLTTIMFMIVFGNIAKLSTDGQPPLLFYMCSVTIWGYFANCLTNTSNTFINNANIFGKVYFPRLAVPVSIVISGLISFAIQLAFFLCFYVYFLANNYDLKPNIWLLAIPFLIFLMALYGLSLGIIISAMTTKYRDLRNLVGFGVQLYMYISAVIIPTSALSPENQKLLALNPVASIIEAFRYAFLGTGAFTVENLIYSTVVTFVLFFFGLIIFNRVEKGFMDTV